MNIGWLKGAAVALAIGANSIGDAHAQVGVPEILRSGSGRPILPDFSYAGYQFGLGALPTDAGTVVDVTGFGAVADDDIDDSRAVMAAIASARSIKGKVTVRFPSGRFLISSILRIERGDFVLEGAGPGRSGTELHFPRPLKMIDTGPEFDELRTYLVKEDKRQVERSANVDALFSEYSWSGGFIRTGPAGNRAAPYLREYDKPLSVLANAMVGRAGGTALTLDNASALAPGQVVQLQWFPVDGAKSAIIASIYGATDLKIGSHHWSFPDRPTVTQATRIVAISGRRVTLGDPLLHDVSAAQPAKVARWDHLSNVGIQGLALTFPQSPWFGHHQEQGYNAIFFTGVFDGWVRDVRIRNADAGILTYDSASVTFRDILVEGDRKGHYAVHVGNAHNVLVTNLTVANPVVHSLSVNTQSTRAVFQRATVLQDAVLDQHSGANHQNLFDDVTVRIAARRIAGVPTYDIWDGSGAPYWQPGHGRYNTTWNLKVDVISGARPGEAVLLRGLDEGPDARIVGISGNRPLRVDYRPRPYLEAIDASANAVPSLYDYQLARRKK